MSKKFKLIIIIFFFLLCTNSTFATCPACLGTVGLPLGGAFSTFLTPFDLDIRYQETSETKDEFWRKIRLINFSLTYNLPESDFSFGARLPFSFAEGFMADGKYHRVTGVSGVDLFTRYFLFKPRFSEHSPMLMAILGTRLPVGTMVHLEHPDVRVPFGLLTGAGGSILITEPLVLYGSSTYLFNFKNSNQFSLGDKFLGVIGANTSLDIGLPTMIGFEMQWNVNFSDNDPTDSDVAKNTDRQVVAIGPKINILMVNNPRARVALDATLKIPLLENKSGTKQLPTSTILEFALGAGF